MVQAKAGNSRSANWTLSTTGKPCCEPVVDLSREPVDVFPDLARRWNLAGGNPVMHSARRHLHEFGDVSDAQRTDESIRALKGLHRKDSVVVGHGDV